MHGEVSEKDLYFPDWPRVVKLATFVLWFIAFALLLITGRYKNFLRPSFGFLVGGAALLVLFVVIPQLGSLKVKHLHDRYCLELGYRCSYKHRFQGRFFYPVLIFLLPLVYIASSSSQGLNTFAAVQRLMSDPGEAGVEVKIDESKIPPTAPEVYPEVKLNKLTSAFAKFTGKPVTVVGMFYTRPEMPEGQFMVMRFVIVCCAADAQPTHVYVLTDPDKVKLPTASDSWVKVKGIAVQGVLGLRPVQAVYAFQVEEVPKPRNPYL